MFCNRRYLLLILTRHTNGSSCFKVFSHDHPSKKKNPLVDSTIENCLEASFGVITSMWGIKHFVSGEVRFFFFFLGPPPKKKHIEDITIIQTSVVVCFECGADKDYLGCGVICCVSPKGVGSP